MPSSPPPVREELPTRWRAFLFFAKACLFRLRRALREPLGRKPSRFPRAEIHTLGRIIGESRTPLFTTSLGAEFALQAGKVQNLRRAAAHLDGVVIPAGGVFSFWAHVPRPTRGRGFAPGRELREGCVIPSVGGGLCQLTNALYDAALQAGCEIVERHAHSRRLPGSAAEAGRDATVFWNYVDLRFRPRAECRLEVTLTRWELVARIRQIAVDISGEAIVPTVPSATPVPAHAAESCETCGVTECFQNPAATSLPQRAVTAYLVDAWWPEHDAYVTAQRSADDWLLTPLDSRRWRIGPYRWNSAGFAKVRQVPFFVVKRALISRRLAAQGPARQKAQLALDEDLARKFARLVPYTALHVVVSQNLLPFLWRDGALAGRSFDVLMTRLPLAALHAQLDAAAQRWPGSETLTDFRAPESLVSAESAALAEARRWITPHSEIARLAGKRALRLLWMLPEARRREPGRRVVFPASDLPRKGSLDLREVAREELLPLALAGSALAPREFWAGCNVARTHGDWLADAGAVVLPAWVENEPRRALAAVVAGIPVLASEACGLEDVAGVSTFPCGDTAALREAIDGALASSPATLLPRAAHASVSSKSASHAPAMITGHNDDRNPRLPPQTVALLPLLIFFFFWFWFIYLALLEAPITEHFFKCEFPSRPGHSRIESPETLTIEIRVDDTVSIAGILTEPSGNPDLPALRRYLSANRDAINQHGGLIIHPEPDVRMDRFIKVISAIKGSGISFYGLR